MRTKMLAEDDEAAGKRGEGRLSPTNWAGPAAARAEPGVRQLPGADPGCAGRPGHRAGRRPSDHDPINFKRVEQIRVGGSLKAIPSDPDQIGRASCWERVGKYL